MNTILAPASRLAASTQENTPRVNAAWWGRWWLRWRAARERDHARAGRTGESAALRGSLSASRSAVVPSAAWPVIHPVERRLRLTHTLVQT